MKQRIDQKIWQESAKERKSEGERAGTGKSLSKLTPHSLPGIHNLHQTIDVDNFVANGMFGKPDFHEFCCQEIDFWLFSPHMSSSSIEYSRIGNI